MNDRTLMNVVCAADPLASDAARADDQSRREVLFETILATPQSAPSRRVTARTVVLFAAVAIAVAVVPAALAFGTLVDLLRGDPAPAEVVAGFGSYRTELGFHPEPGKAVRVARDGDVSLYVTTNSEGTYCLTITAPWKPATQSDGGGCVTRSEATASFIVGLGGVGPSRSDRGTTMIVHGRTSVAGAVTIRFLSPDGEVVTSLIGPGGFFMAAVRLKGMFCDVGQWTPTFAVLGAAGNELATETATLTRGCARP